MLYLYSLVVGIYEAIWRRSHGGGLIHDWYDKWIKPWLKINYRIPSVIINSIVVFELAYGLRQLVQWQSLIVVGLVWLFWDYTFGMYMSIGRPFGRTITDDDKEEYAKAWFDWILRLVFPYKMWYGAWYDFAGMWIRFTFPLVPLCFMPSFTLWILLLGAIVPICYWLEIYLHEQFPKTLSWKLLNSELMSGFAAGIFLTLA